jgi:hypothetical protein
MEKGSDHLAKMQEQTTVRKTLLERGKIRLIPEESHSPRIRQNGQEVKKSDPEERQLPLIPRHCR